MLVEFKMISRSFQLVSPYLFEQSIQELDLTENEILIEPSFLSICAADLRYYTGKRGSHILKEKLPMSLIHEAVGKILHDPKGEYQIGDNVVLIPNIPGNNSKYKENYARDSKFKSSSEDGFMQDIIAIDRTRVIALGDIDILSASMIELMSVIYNNLNDIENELIKDGDTFGIWGNGNLGYLANLILKDKYPNSKVYVYGKNEQKNNFFKQADSTFEINEEFQEGMVDHAFECVGGSGSEKAINQIIDLINPQGVISLLGVSEQYPSINTRMILEKGLTLQGSSRSGYSDFNNAVKFLEKDEKNQQAVKRLITEVVEIKELADIKLAFDASLSNNFKTVMKWNV